MTSAGEHEADFILEEQFSGDLTMLAMAWQELGIDPDAFLKCGKCHAYFIDEHGNDIPCQCERKEL
jgi:hypothetical protein